MQAMIDFFCKLTVHDIVDGEFKKCGCEECLEAYKRDPALETMIDTSLEAWKEIQPRMRALMKVYQDFKPKLDPVSESSLLYTEGNSQ